MISIYNLVEDISAVQCCHCFILLIWVVHKMIATQASVRGAGAGASWLWST